MTIDVSLKKELSSHRSKNKDSIPDGLDQRIVSSSKQVLLCKIDFTPAEQSFSYSLSNLRTKYVSLNPKKSNLTEGETDQRRKKGNKMGTGNEKTAVEASDGIPKPRQTLFQPDKVRLSWHKVYRIGAGLMNLGNTCFLNSILQCLTYTPPLTNYLLSQQHSQSCREAGFCMMCELQRHAGRAFHQCGSAIRPMVIIQKIKNIGKQFRYGHQEDAHEFLRCVTEAMQKSCLVGYEKLEKHSKETTLVHQIFGGYYRSRVQCNKCQEISDTHDPFLDISLDIKHVPSIIKALERMIKPETLDNDNMYMCKRCKVKVPAVKKLTVHRAPNVLTISLKRFDFHRFMGSKINKDVRYPEILDLHPYMSQKTGGPIMYRLYAVLVHHGYSCNSGHYYCYVRAPNEAWYCMNDSSITQSNIKTVLDQEAYILFYIKSNMKTTNSFKEKTAQPATQVKFTNTLPSSSLVNSVSNPTTGAIGKSIVRLKPQPVTTPKEIKPAKLFSTSESSPRPTTIPVPSKRDKIQFNITMKPKQNNQSTVRNEETKAKTSDVAATNKVLVAYTSDSDDSWDEYDETVARLSNLPTREIKQKQHHSVNSTNSDVTQVDNVEKEKTTEQSSIKIEKKTESTAKQTLNVTISPKEDNDLRGVNDEKVEKDKGMKPPNFLSPIGKTSSNVLSRMQHVAQSSPLKLTLNKVNKVNATSHAWRVSDLESQISPSLASDSSNHSLNSTGSDWQVIDKKDAPCTPKVPEYSHPGWKVTTPEEHTECKKRERITETDEEPKKYTLEDSKSPANCKHEHDNVQKMQEPESCYQSEVVTHNRNGHIKRENIDKSCENSETTVNGHNEKRMNGNEHRHKRKWKKDCVDEHDLVKRRKDNETEYDKKSTLLNGNGHHHKKHKKHKKLKKKKSKHRHSHYDDSDSDKEYRREKRKKKTKHESGEESAKEKKTHKGSSQHWDYHIKDGYKKSHEDSGRHRSWDGRRTSSAVDELLAKPSSKAYGGGYVESWDGGKSVLDQDAERDRKVRKQDDDYDEDYDSGKKKRIKYREENDFKPKYNPFQTAQNFKNYSYPSKGYHGSHREPRHHHYNRHKYRH